VRVVVSPDTFADPKLVNVLLEIFVLPLENEIPFPRTSISGIGDPSVTVSEPEKPVSGAQPGTKAGEDAVEAALE